MEDYLSKVTCTRAFMENKPMNLAKIGARLEEAGVLWMVNRIACNIRKFVAL